MSHGNMERCEPNLTPMLDMVLQLVMFFMLCANFVMEETNATINLPIALGAKTLDKKDDKIIFLNVDKEGTVHLSALDAAGASNKLTNAVQVSNYLKQRSKEDAAKSKPGGEPLRSVIIIRADRAARFEKVQAVMDACRNAEYTQVRLRAKVGNPGEDKK